jgi:hypothetical protein
MVFVVNDKKSLRDNLARVGLDDERSALDGMALMAVTALLLVNLLLAGCPLY